MTTEYSLADTLPKDLGGAKHLGVIDDQTSQLDYALIRGIASESLGGASRNLAMLGVSSHTIGSAIGHGGGVMSMGAYTESPSGIGTGNAQAVRVNKEGHVYTMPASGVLSYGAAASVQTHVTGSALLFGVNILGVDVNAGETVKIQDGNDYKLGYVFSSTSETINVNFSVGVPFLTSINHESDNTNASVTLIYSQQ